MASKSNEGGKAGASGIVQTFRHPVAGASAREPRYLAVRWRAEAATAAKEALLREAGVELATLDPKAERPLPQVNRTEGLWWVQGEGGRPVSDDAVAKLEASDLVEWVSPAFQSAREKASLFTVNPSRFYVKRSAIEGARGIGALGAGLRVDTARTTRLPGYVVVTVDNPSLLAGRSVLTTGAAAEAALARAGAGPARGGDVIKYETIPFLSPTCHTARCAPPAGELTPDDPMFADQWGLQRTNVPRAWQIVRGSPAVTIAVIDEGVQLDHPDLELHPQSWNASNDVPDGSPTGAHGTACAGIAAARLDNAQGVAGAAGGARIMAIATATWADIDIAEGLYFAADNGARVVSMSFGVYPSWMVWDFALIQDALQHAYDRGLVLVAASGNEDGPEARFPGSDARTICVGGSNRSDERKRGGDSSSEPWWGASYGPHLDVVAPCLEMPTTDQLAGDGYSVDDYFDRFNGTSSATPLVAGIAALLVSLKPSLTNVEVRRLIESTCDKIAPHLYAYANTAGKPSGTWHEEVGYGRVNAERAVLAACALAEEAEEECTGCGGGCVGETPAACRGPAPVPWLPSERCMSFLEVRSFDFPALEERRVQIRITYEHRLCLLGRRQGPLLYTTTLLPGEEVQVYEYDRFRRVRSDTERVSVHTSFRQTVSALSQARRASSSSAYFDALTDVRAHADTSVAAGGGLAGFFGAPQVRGEAGFESQTTVASGASTHTAAEQFAQLATTASQSVEAERSVVVSRFEDSEHATTTARRLKNDNACYAVTYFVRRVDEVYELSTRVVAIEWRAGDGPWRSITDLSGTSEALRRLFEVLFRQLPPIGEVVSDPRRIAIPTDGTLYEAELAHCSSCEPLREAEELVRLEQLRLAARKQCLEIELLALELERRRALTGSGSAEPLQLGTWPLASATTTSEEPKPV